MSSKPRSARSAGLGLAAFSGLVFTCFGIGETNLLPNPGFETAQPLGWVFFDREQVGNHGGRDTTQAHTGKASLRIEGKKAGWTYFRLPEGQSVPLEPNTYYYIGSAVKMRQAVSLRFRVLVRESDAKGREVMAVQALESPPTEQPGEGPWREYGALFRTQPKTARATIWLELEAGLGTIWFDDVILVKGKCAPDSVCGTETIDGEGRFYARLSKSLWIKETEQVPAIDGKAEELWQQAKTGSGFTSLADYSQSQAVEFPAPARNATEVQMLRDRERLYILARCNQTPPASQSPNEQLRFQWGTRTGFGLTSQGQVLDLTGNPLASSGIVSSVLLSRDSWEAEIAVPLKLVPELTSGRCWGEITRVTPIETSVWAGSPAGQALGIFAFAPTPNPILSLSLRVALCAGNCNPVISGTRLDAMQLQASLTPLGAAGAAPQSVPVQACSRDAVSLTLPELSPGMYRAAIELTRSGKLENLFGWTFEVFPQLETVFSATYLYPDDEGVKVTVHDRAAIATAGRYSFVLTGADGKPRWQTNFPWQKELKSVPVPCPLKGDEFRLSIALADAAGRPQAQTAQTLRRLPAPPSYAAIRTVTTAGGKVFINGEPVLLLEGYAMNRNPGPGRREGLFCMQGDSSDRDDLVQQLDLAKSLNLYTFCGLFHRYFAESEGGHYYNPARLREGLALVKQHPALLFWEPYDEPDGHQLPAEDFVKLRQELHELDPDHPVYMTFCDRGKYRAFADTCDVFGIDIYSPSVLEIIEGVRAARAAIGPDKPIHLILSSYMPDFNSEPRLFPLLLVRAEVYAGLVQGARSLAFYDYFGMGNENAIAREPTRRFQCFLRGLTHELRSVSPFLLNGTPTQSVRLESPAQALCWKTFEYHGERLLIAVNPLPIPVQARLFTESNREGKEQNFGPYEVCLRKF